MRAALCVLFALVLSACGAVLPGEGPSAEAIIRGAQPDAETGEKKADYLIIPVNDRILTAQLRHEPKGLRATFGMGSPKAFSNRIGVGDVLRVYLWEAADNGLFSTTENKSTEFPPMQVDRHGRITIPFVGMIRAAGYTPFQLQERIRKRLEGKAISPQVMVLIERNVANSVIVNGDVRKPGRYELSLKGDRILDVIAAAGGAATPARETMVSLVRKGRKGIQSLKRIIDNPSENIYVRPGDQIYLSHNPQTFTAFGAVSKKGEYPFDSDRVSLLEAVARAGGLLDNRANAGGVFLFRYERNKILRDAGYDPAELHESGVTPTIYVLDMRKPRAFFMAQAFMMHDNDVIYVANSVGTELEKFLRLLNLGTATIRSSVSTVNVLGGN